MTRAESDEARPDRRMVLKGGAATLAALAAPAAPLAAVPAPPPAGGAVFSAQPLLFGVASPSVAGA